MRKPKTAPAAPPSVKPTPGTKPPPAVKPNTTTKKPHAGFQPGNNANPNGRPVGSKNRVLLALDKIGGDAAQGILARAVTEALAGDMRACELIMSRVWPARKSRPVTVTLPSIQHLADFPPAVNAVLAAVTSGHLTPDEAQAISAVMETARRAIDSVDLERRLSAIEERLGHEVD